MLNYAEYIERESELDSRQAWIWWKVYCGMSLEEATKAADDPEWGYTPLVACIVGRPINGVTINGDEYLRDADTEETLVFPSKESAIEFLKSRGFDDEEISGLNFYDYDASLQKDRMKNWRNELC